MALLTYTFRRASAHLVLLLLLFCGTALAQSDVKDYDAFGTPH